MDITYRNLEKLGLNILDRKAIFDIYCTDERGDNFIVELQRSKQKYFRDRSVYYTTFPIQEQSKKGSWDYYLKRVYFIGILEFKMDDSEEYKPIKEAFDIAEFLALDRDKQFAYQLDLKARLDYKNVMDYAKETAKEEGRKEEKIQIAKNLLDILDIETNLP